MDFIENAASKYMKGQGGGGSGGGNGGGDLDWSHLSGLANQFGKADSQTNGELDASTFKKFLGGFGGSSGGIAAATGNTSAQANLNQPAGYPGSDKAPNTNVINQLLGHYQQTTGEQFTGQESQYSKLEEIAYKLSGSKIPLPILKKMVSWKLNGMM